MQMLKRRKLVLLAGVGLLVFSHQGWGAKVNANTCKSKWSLTASSPTLSFGSFAVESGSGSLSMDSNATVTTVGAITTTTASVVSNFVVVVDNGTSADCGTFPFDLSWSVLPTDLVGPGTAMPLTNVLVSEPTWLPTPTALPITGLTLSTASLPITLTFQAELSATFPQAAGTYTSPGFTLDLTQSGSTTSINGTATATAITPLSISEALPMGFGMVAGGTLAGTVVLDINGNRTTTGDGQILAAGAGTAATFNVSGEQSLSYVISYGSGVLSDGLGNTMSVNNFTDNRAGVGTLSAVGTDTFNVGATLTLYPLQPAGNYSTANAGGTPYSVTVNYQ